VVSSPAPGASVLVRLRVQQDAVVTFLQVWAQGDDILKLAGRPPPGSVRAGCPSRGLAVHQPFACADALASCRQLFNQATSSASCRHLDIGVASDLRGGRDAYKRCEPIARPSVLRRSGDRRAGASWWLRSGSSSVIRRAAGRVPWYYIDDGLYGSFKLFDPANVIRSERGRA
jgi:hypothetical protein